MLVVSKCWLISHSYQCSKFWSRHKCSLHGIHTRILPHHFATRLCFYKRRRVLCSLSPKHTFTTSLTPDFVRSHRLYASVTISALCHSHSSHMSGLHFRQSVSPQNSSGQILQQSGQIVLPHPPVPATPSPSVH